MLCPWSPSRAGRRLPVPSRLSVPCESLRSDSSAEISLRTEWIRGVSLPDQKRERCEQLGLNEVPHPLRVLCPLLG